MAQTVVIYETVGGIIDVDKTYEVVSAVLTAQVNDVKLSVNRSFATEAAALAATDVIADQSVQVAGREWVYKALGTYTASPTVKNGAAFQLVSTSLTQDCTFAEDTRPIEFLRSVYGASGTVDAQYDGFRYSLDLAQAGAGHVTTAAGVALSVAPADGWINFAAFGPAGDGASDDTAQIEALNAAILSTKSNVIIPDGTYLTSTALQVRGYGITVVGTGKAVIKGLPGAPNTSLTVGEYVPGNLSWMRALAANLAKGANSVAVSDGSGYAVDDVVLIVSGSSINSSGANVIPLYKQWFTISGVSGNTLTFYEQAEYAFNTADDARVIPPTVSPAIRCTIENIQFANESSHSGSYLHLVELAFQVTLRNVAFDGYSACGAVLNSDHITYENCTFKGYSGISSARGTKRITWKECSYNPRLLPEGNAAFIEETPERASIYNCDFHGTFRVTANGDNSPPKVVILRDSRIYSSGLAVVMRAYNADGFAFHAENCEFHAAGGTNAATRTSVISLESFDSARIHNCAFVGASGAAYAVDGSSFGGTARVDLQGNNYGASLGVHSSLPQSNKHFSSKIAVGGYQTKGNSLVSISQGSVAGAYDANSQLIVERTGGVAGINIKTDIAQTGILSFADADDAYVAALTYNHATDEMALYANNANRLLIDNGGNVKPATDNNRASGGPAHRWSVVYAGTGTINTSDAREKKDIRSLDEAELRVAVRLKGLIRAYRWKDATALGDKIQVGLIAQEVVAAFASEGLDAADYGAVTHDEWDAGDRYGVRYDQIFAFIVAAL